MIGLLEMPLSVQDEIKNTLGIEELFDHPGVTGLAYLRLVDKAKYWKYFALPENIDWPMIRSVSVSALAEFRKPSNVELGRKWLYCYDRNSSHPYAASQLKCGIGQPVAVQNIKFDHLIPGFWAADIEGLDNLWPGLELLPTHRDWLPTPLLKMAERQGCKITVHEAYVWPEKAGRAPVFARWANNLWALRQQYAKGTDEREAIKSIMNMSIGLLRRKTGEGHRDYRPDWYSLVLAEERAVVWYKAQQVDELTGHIPVGAYHDALYYCEDDDIGLTPLVCLKNGHSSKDSLGGYKISWKLPLDEWEIRDILCKTKISPSDRIKELKAWGREHGYEVD